MIVWAIDIDDGIYEGCKRLVEEHRRMLGFHVTSQHMQIRRPPYWCRKSLLAYVKMQCFGA